MLKTSVQKIVIFCLYIFLFYRNNHEILFCLPVRFVKHHWNLICLCEVDRKTVSKVSMASRGLQDH